MPVRAQGRFLNEVNIQLSFLICRFIKICIVPIFLSLQISQIVAAQDFIDVPPSYWAYSFINELRDSGITGGCTNESYCPDDFVTRAQMAVFVLKATKGSDFMPSEATGQFNDVPISNPFADWIEQFATEGITGGCGANLYCPDDPVTREQMAVFLLKAFKGTTFTPPAATGIFGDVPTNSPFAIWIEELAEEGITGGCGGGDYCPKNPVTRAQMAVFIIKAIQILSSTNCMSADFNETAVSGGQRFWGIDTDTCQLTTAGSPGGFALLVDLDFTDSTRVEFDLTDNNGRVPDYMITTGNSQVIPTSILSSDFVTIFSGNLTYSYDGSSLTFQGTLSRN